MVKGNFTKIMQVYFVNGGIKCTMDLTPGLVKRALEECSDKELHDLYYALDDEILRRAARGTEVLTREEVEEVALDAMYD